MSLATLSGLRVTSARAWLPAWGVWYADASVDGEQTLTGSVELKIADLTLRGTVLSGGASKGRSHFRIVGGAGGWGKILAKRSYATDLGVRLGTVLGDAASEVGETLDTSTFDPRKPLGASFARPPKAPAARVLELVARRAWYVGEDGITRLGARPSSSYSGKATRGPVDLARGTVTLAAESIATLLPGVVVDGLEAVDVLHEVTPKGLRTTLWGRVSEGAPGSRRLAALAKLLEQLDPDRRYRGVTEYRVALRQGKRVDLSPVRKSAGLPDLLRVRLRPGVPGCEPTVTLGTRVLVAFVDSDPSRPAVVGFEDTDGEGFSPVSLNLTAGGQVGGEHLMTVEACALLIYNTLVALMAAAGGGPLLAAVLQPLLGAAVNAAITAQGAPAPPGTVAQAAAAAALLPSFATGTVPANTSAFFDSAIAGALAAKTPNASGLFPSLGCAAVKGG